MRTSEHFSTEPLLDVYLLEDTEFLAVGLQIRAAVSGAQMMLSTSDPEVMLAIADAAQDAGAKLRAAQCRAEAKRAVA